MACTEWMGRAPEDGRCTLVGGWEEVLHCSMQGPGRSRQPNRVMSTPNITAVAGQGRLVVPSSCSSLAGVWQREQCAAAQRRPAGRPAGRERAGGGRQGTSSAINVGRGAIGAHRCTAGMATCQLFSWVGGRVLFFQRQVVCTVNSQGNGSTALDISRSAWWHSSGCTTRPGGLSSTASRG